MARALTAGPDFSSHLRAAEDENVAWLLSRGVSLEEALSRVGVSPSAWEKRHRG